MKRISTILTMLMLVCMGAWAQVTSITDGDMYTIRLNKNNAYFFGYHYKTSSDAAPFRFVYADESEGDYKLYYLQCPFTGLYLHSTRTEKDGTSISLEWVNSTSSATSYTIRPTTSGATTFRIFPKGSTYSLTAWNYNNPNYNIVPYDNTNELGVWNLISANNVNEYEFQVNNLTGDFSRTGGGSSDWKDKWDAKASLFSLQITTSVNNSSKRYDMQYNSPNLKIASSSDKTAYYTMTAPLGCVISGYRISGTTDGAITLIKGDGTSIAYDSGATLTDVGESGIARKVTKFTLKGDNKAITGSLYIKVRKLKTITSVSEINRNKCYAIDTKDRGNWSVRNNYGYLTRNVATGLNIASDFADSKQQFAFVYHDGTDNEKDDGFYYLYSVSAHKFITAAGTTDNSLVTLDTKGTQSISFITSGVTNYPVCIEMSNTADLNVRADNWEAGVTVYGTSGSKKDDDGNAVRIYEIADFDPTAAEDTWNTVDVTYSLYYNGKKIGDNVVVEDVTAGTPAVIPSSMDNGFMTYTYTPANVSSLSPSVRIDATWNGPFQISSAPSDGNFASGTKWYTIAHNYSERANNYIWKYNGTDNIVPEMVATDNFAGVTNNHLFCFVGDPYTGFTIYNKAAGTSKNVYSSAQGNQVTMNATAQLFIPSRTDGHAVSDGYFSLKPSGSSYYLNWNKVSLAGWTSADNGGTCWVVAPGQYYLNFIDGLCLDAPVGAVGTRSYFQTVADPTTAKSNISSMRTTVAGNMYSDQLNTLNMQLTPIAGSSVITLTDGYYQILSALPEFVKVSGTMRRMIFNGTAIGWSNDMDANNINAIFKLANMGADNAFSIYSGNGQNYLSNGGGALGSATAVTITEAAAKTAQYSFYLEEGYNSGHHYLHALGHDSGSGTSGSLTAWNAGANTASAWYILPVGKYDITMNAVGGDYYASGYWPMDVTISGATAYTLAENGDWLVPTLLEGNQVPAGTAVLLKGTSATATATINTGAAFSTDNENALQGTYVPKDFALNGGATEEYFLGVYKGKIGFYRSEVESKDDYYTLGANKAYLASGVSARGFAIMWEESETTGVNEVIGNMSEVTDGAIYDLQGRKVANPSRGMYIINGRKIVIK